MVPRIFLKNHFSELMKEPIRYNKDSKLRIISHKLIKGKKTFSIVGEIENNDKLVWESISILAAFRDKKNEVSNVTSTYISNLRRGEKRPFEVAFGCSDIGYDPSLHATYTVEIEDARGNEKKK